MFRDTATTTKATTIHGIRGKKSYTTCNNTGTLRAKKQRDPVRKQDHKAATEKVKKPHPTEDSRDRARWRSISTRFHLHAA